MKYSLEVLSNMIESVKEIGFRVFIVWIDYYTIQLLAQHDCSVIEFVQARELIRDIGWRFDRQFPSVCLLDMIQIPTAKRCVFRTCL